MIKNRTAQLIFQSFYCAFGLVAIAGSLGLFDYTYYWDFYIYFTNISSFLGVGIMLAELVQTARRKGDGYVTLLPGLKFVSMLGIVLTFLVFNLLIAPSEGRDPALNFTTGSVMFHMLLPILYLLDWFLFYERGKVKKSYPFLASLFPLGYLLYVFLHAWILHFDASIRSYDGTVSLIYPYFFLDVPSLGIAGVARWVVILLVFFIVGGLLLLGLDRLLCKKKA